MNVKERYDIATKKMSEKNKPQACKFMASLADGVASDEAFDILTDEKVDIYPTSGHDFVIYAIEPRTLKHYVDLATQMDFIGDIRRRPRRLSTPSMAKIIERMGQCDAAHIPYKDEKTNLCANFIFDEKEFAEKIIPLIKGTSVDKTTDETDEIIQMMDYKAPTNNEVSIMNFDVDANEKKEEIKKHAQKLLEIFSLNKEEDSNNLMVAIDKIDVNELSEKEILMATFTDVFQVADLNLLSTEIDHVLEMSMDDDFGRKKVA